jgi:broad specificity phosphatase PhoE
MDAVKSKWPDELVIIRHGQSERNVAKDAAKAAGGKLSYVDSIRDQDTPLTALGMGQALEVGVRLRPDNPDFRTDAILVSPYLRTRQTAAQIILGLGYVPEIVVDERLREIEFGILDGLTPQGIEAKFPEEIQRRRKEGKYWYRPPGGESRPDVALRIHSLLDTLTRDYAGKRVMVVCHSVVVLVFRRLLERWGEEEYLKVDKEDDVKNCSITRYSVNNMTGKLVLRCYNRTFVPGGGLDPQSAKDVADEERARRVD